MVEYPEIDRYAGLSSPIHLWDPRAKLVAILCLIFSVVLITDLMMAMVGLAVALFLVFISRIPFGFVLKHLARVSIFIFPLCVLILFTYHQGDEIARFYFLTVTSGGIEHACLIAVRALAAVILIFPLIGTMRFDVAIKALGKLKVPNKLVQMLIFTYRYIFVFIEEVQRMFRALTSRGFTGGMNGRTLRATGRLIGMLLVRTLERAERVYNAMVSRGYEGNLGTLVEFKIGGGDILKAAILIAIAIALNVF
ncbi:MAG: Energy-coupling factor transporter transmembrane protein EcfT [Syntrophomonadaceae bacterium]|nr:Energy-coupling factor transporter transmembrane protein EcfT [Bacillota bacterium]MBT9138806.1 Energy-coupling factor transporter transmembrane protein EcfT [Bacillota bacterium]MBT9146510.1 Energy-coupling factor transporter transmembrane protein EcfT [Bacillota bacterium]